MGVRTQYARVRACIRMRPTGTKAAGFTLINHTGLIVLSTQTRAKTDINEDDDDANTVEMTGKISFESATFADSKCQTSQYRESLLQAYRHKYTHIHTHHPARRHCQSSEESVNAIRTDQIKEFY